MFKTTCSKCSGPRELDSTSMSWCKKCIKAYQRKRYRDQREAVGKPVRIRATDEVEESTPAPVQTITEEDQREHKILTNVLATHSKGQNIVICVACDTEILPGEPIHLLTKWINFTSHFEKLDLIKGFLCAGCHEFAEAAFKVGAARANKILHIIITKGVIKTK